MEGTGQNPSSTTDDTQNLVTNNNCNLNKDKFIYVTCFNTRTLRTEERFEELKNALDKTKWDIIGLSETRRFGEQIKEEENGNIFAYIGETRGLHGVGFYVKNHLKPFIVDIRCFNERIIGMKLKIKNRTLSIIQCYAPTSASTPAELESFYEHLEKATQYFKAESMLVMGDFNCKIGVPRDDEQIIMGKYGIGVRNDRGERLIQFLWEKRLTVANTLFKKRDSKKWTWISPRQDKNEIDFILTNDRKIVQDVDVLNQFEFASDHRPVRAKILLNHTTKRHPKKKLVLNTNISNNQLNLYKSKLTEMQLPVNDDGLYEVQPCFDKLTCYVKSTAEETIYKEKPKTSKISEATRSLIEHRKEVKNRLIAPISQQEKEQIKALNLEISTKIKEDINIFNHNLIKSTLETTKSIKKARNSLNTDKEWITKTKRNNKNVTNRIDINDLATSFYKKLYKTTRQHHETTTNFPEASAERVPEFLESEVENVIKNLKNDKAFGNDGLQNEMFKYGMQELTPTLTNLFNSVLHSNDIPTQWLNSTITLLHKKGDRGDINNYRPISGMSLNYTIFSKCVYQRMKTTLNSHQPREQAGFRSGYSTTDHIHTINQIIEKSTEYQIPVYLVFIDFSKAFDTLEHNFIWEALLSQGVHEHYVHILSKIYKKSTAQIKTDKIGTKFKVERGVRQGDPISPILFSATLEQIFRDLKWENYGISINGEKLNNLRFADDIVLISNKAEDIQAMLTELSNQCKLRGLLINESKTRMMTNRAPIPIYLERTPIEYVNDFTYLGQNISFMNREEKIIQQRINNSWKQFWSLKDILDQQLSIETIKYLMDTAVLPVQVYSTQTLPLTSESMRKLAVCQRSMERILLKINLSDRIPNQVIRERTKIADVIERTRSQKWEWAGHVERIQDNRWTKMVTNWIPYDYSRRVGGQAKRWRTSLDKFHPQWYRKARQKDEWKELREAFTFAST